MYDRIIQKFKEELICRQLEKRTVFALSVLFLFYLICIVTLQSIYRTQWWITLVGIVALIIITWIILCSTVYITSKNKLNLNRKDYFRCFTTYKRLNSMQPSDVEILLPIIKSAGISTQPKKLEAIKHFQLLLSIKNHHGMAIVSIISLTLSVISIIIPATASNNKNFFILLMLLVAVILYIVFICFFIKFVYNIFYYNLSEHALLVRIEAALSEIWMKQLIK